VNEWLSRQADELAAAAGVDRAALELDDEGVDTLLDLARIAAHQGGERTNAPLLCYLVGLANAGGKSLDELAETVRASSS
jgi:Domain of unknown function (DUF6457)